jgi:hypothetical protein
LSVYLVHLPGLPSRHHEVIAKLGVEVGEGGLELLRYGG